MAMILPGFKWEDHDRPWLEPRLTDLVLQLVDKYNLMDCKGVVSISASPCLNSLTGLLERQHPSLWIHFSGSQEDFLASTLCKRLKQHFAVPCYMWYNAV